MKVNVFSIEGKGAGNIELPAVFSTPFRPDIITRAVISAQKNRMQPYGINIDAGHRTSAKYMGTRKGYGHSYSYGQSRIPRLMINKGGRRVGKAKIVPQAVGGRRAHPPKTETVRGERINRKEARLAVASAIAATGVKELVAARGHRVSKVPSFPLVVDSSFEKISKAAEVKKTLGSLGLMEDVERIEKRKRAGKGGTRGRPFRRGKSVLIVVSSKSPVSMAARNLAGVDVVSVKGLNAEALAPGTKAGRLTLWTKAAMEGL